MACTPCATTAPLTAFDVQYFYSNQCFDCGGDDSCPTTSNSKCVIYTGPNLSCSGVATNDSLETALQKIDEQICSLVGDYSNYQFNCLPTWLGSSITTEAQFVDAITAYACDLSASFYIFADSAFVDYQATVAARFDAIETPSLTCVFAGVTPADTLQQILSRYCNAFTLINNTIDVSGITWDACLTVVTPPTNVAQGLQLLADQICQVNASVGGTLPTFNNIGTCLSSPGATDSLVDTVDKIITKLCILPEFDVTGITWGCVGAQTNLQSTIEVLIAQSTILTQNYATYSGDFAISATDPMDPCAGITVGLAVPLNQDRFVAASALDASPDTLINKLSSLGNTIDITNNADTTVNLEVAGGDRIDLTIAGTIWTINPDTVTFAKMQNVNSAVLLGRATAGSGDVEEISLGTGLLLSGTTLLNTGKTLVSISTFTSNGTWTPNANTNSAVVVSVAGGGGGGGVSGGAAEAAAAGGGGGGGFGIHYLSSIPNPSEAVTIGGAGAGGATGANDGSDGGNTSLGALITVTGGKGGKAMATGTTATASLGGDTGVVSVSTGVILGQGGDPGGPGIRFSGTFAISGDSGSSLYNGRRKSVIASGVGASGNAVGVGGGGAVTTDGNDYAGGAGLTGFMIIYEYS